VLPFASPARSFVHPLTLKALPFAYFRSSTPGFRVSSEVVAACCSPTKARGRGLFSFGDNRLLTVPPFLFFLSNIPDDNPLGPPERFSYFGFPLTRSGSPIVLYPWCWERMAGPSFPSLFLSDPARFAPPP